MEDEIDVSGAAPYNPRKGEPPLTGCKQNYVLLVFLLSFLYTALSLTASLVSLYEALGTELIRRIIKSQKICKNKSTRGFNHRVLYCVMK